MMKESVCRDGRLRTNKNVPKDQFRDYDISYLVPDMESFKKDDQWLDYFGDHIISSCRNQK